MHHKNTFYGLLIAILVLALTGGPAAAAPPFIARVTHYGWTGDVMFSGAYPYPGAAACSSVLPLGTQVRLIGKGGHEITVTCLDRGRLESEIWVDVFVETPEVGAFIAGTFSPYSYALVTLPR